MRLKSYVFFLLFSIFLSFTISAPSIDSTRCEKIFIQSIDWLISSYLLLPNGNKKLLEKSFDIKREHIQTLWSEYKEDKFQIITLTQEEMDKKFGKNDRGNSYLARKHQVTYYLNQSLTSKNMNELKRQLIEEALLKQPAQHNSEFIFSLLSNIELRLNGVKTMKDFDEKRIEHFQLLKLLLTSFKESLKNTSLCQYEKHLSRPVVYESRSQFSSVLMDDASRRVMGVEVKWAVNEFIRSKWRSHNYIEHIGSLTQVSSMLEVNQEPGEYEFCHKASGLVLQSTLGEE